MQWTKPELKVISLNMEVTAYANTDDAIEPRTVAHETQGVAQSPPASVSTLKGGLRQS